jgi:signal transduction histidine kinase
METPFENEVRKRFGVFPNFFRLASADSKIAANLWGFAQCGYLDNPLPSLFKERLFVYLSRFCEVRYCIARHLGFLVGRGHPAGDASCLPQSVELVLPLLRRPLPYGDELRQLLMVCSEFEKPLSTFPVPDSPGEQALFAFSTHVFLQTPDAARSHQALGNALGADNLEHLNLLLAFVRTAHYWTKLHPELPYEEDVAQLLATHEAVANCVLRDPESQRDSLSRQVTTELASLRDLRSRHESMALAYQELGLDHQWVKHSLHAAEENLRELVSVMPAAIFACDRDGFITYHNRAAVEIWGRTPGLGDPPWSFLNLCPAYLPDGTLVRAEDAPLRKVLATGVPLVDGEYVIERPDQSRINVLSNIRPLHDSTGDIIGAVIVFQDVTALKVVQQEHEILLHELKRSNRELSQFSYTVSHDLQAPVRHVRALTQLLVQRADLRGDSPQLAVMIEQATDGMERLIRSLLRYAEAGHGQLNHRSVQVDEIIQSVRATLEPLIVKTGAQIICRPLPAVEADPVLLEQLLQNLVANAIQYHRPEEAPLVELLAELSEEGWQFAVKDNGQGISPSYQDRVFEPLKRLHGPEIPGTGLGLALCRTIVTRHGGRIWVESEGAGHGSIFRFTLAKPKEVPTIIQSWATA